MAEDPAPDDWIDTYVNGSSHLSRPQPNKDDSSLRARLDSLQRPIFRLVLCG